MNKHLFKEKKVFTLVAVAFFFSLILSLVFFACGDRIEKNQKSEIEETLSLLFPAGKDMERTEETFQNSQIEKIYTFTDSKGEKAAYGAVFCVKDQHKNTFLLVAKKDGTIIGLRPLNSFGAHPFPDGAYNEAFLDLFKGKSGPIYLEEEISFKGFTDVLRPVSEGVNFVLETLTAKGDAK